MPLKRLVYVSRAVADLDPRDIVRLAGRAWHRNAADGLSGLLCAAEGCFLQVLEGHADAVNATFGRIMRDPRHTDVRLVSYDTIERRHFDGWKMGFVDLAPGHRPDALARYGSAGYGPFPVDPVAAVLFLDAVAHRAEQADQAA